MRSIAMRSICILRIGATSVRYRHRRTLQASFSSVAVLGGGVTGTTIVAMLVDEGHDVTWIDENHDDIGRFGRFYSSGVPANTPNHVLLKGLTGVKAFEYDQYCRSAELNNIITLSDLAPEACVDLKYLYEPLYFASSRLRAHPNVTTVTGKLTLAEYFKVPTCESKYWTFTVDTLDDSIHSDIFFMAPGAVPSFPTNVPKHFPHQSIDVFVNSHAVARFLDEQSTKRELPWAVVGSSHSAMLAIKNLVDAGVKNIVNFYRSDFVFESQTAAGWYRHRGSGLKGDVGKWVQDELETCGAVTRQRLLSDEELAHKIVPFGDQVVFAVGFQRNLTFTMYIDGKLVCPESFTAYDKCSGEISILKNGVEANIPLLLRSGQCFGLGIAFPANHTDEEGNTEAWVGFHRNIEQMRRILLSKSLWNS